LLRSQIGRVQGDVCDFQGKPVVIGSLRSLCKPNRYPPELYRYFGLLIGDEIHRWAAEYMGVIATLFFARRRLGLSATPERVDGRDLQVAAHVGPIRAEMIGARKRPKVFCYKTGWVCPRNRAGVQIPHSPGKIALLLPSIVNHGRRNMMICHFARMARSKGRRVVIFSDHTEHLDTLATKLPLYGIPLVDVGRYYGSGKERSGAALKAQGHKPVVLATPGKAGDGTDYPEWDTLILATPRSNIEQIVGRVLRDDPKNPDKQPVVFDLQDDDSAVLRSYAKARKRTYQKLQAVSITESGIADEELVAYAPAV
jgi:superfamily II DNA or RNA helicase